MFIDPTITWVPSGFSGYIWLDTKIVFKKTRTLWETLNSILHCNPSDSSPAWHIWPTFTFQFIPPIFQWHNWTHSFQISLIWFPDPHLFPIIPPYLSNFNPATFTEIHNLVSPLKCHSSDQINSLSKSCHFHTRDICRIFPLFPLYVATSLANSLFFSKLDYFNSLYNAISQANSNKIQRIQNALARVVTHTSNLNTSQQCSKITLASNLNSNIYLNNLKFVFKNSSIILVNFCKRSAI